MAARVATSSTPSITGSSPARVTSEKPGREVRDFATSGVVTGSPLFESPDRNAMLAVKLETPEAPNAGELRLREVLSIAFAAPQFQRR